MSERRRRTKRGFLRAAGLFAAELPFRIAALLPHRKSGPRADRKWSRPKRIAIAITVVIVTAGATTTWIVVSKGRGNAQATWRLHDQALEQFGAGRFEDVVATCRKILLLSPGDYRAQFNLGAALVRLGRTEEGLREITRSAENHADFDDANLALAQAALAHGDEAEAFERLSLVTANPPTSGLARSMFATLLQRRGDDPGAKPHLEAAAADTATDPVVRIRAGLALGRLHGLWASMSIGSETSGSERRAESDCYAAARQVAEIAIARAAASELAELHAARAEVLLATGRPGEALLDADLALAAAKDPSELAALRLLRAQIYFLAGDPAAAEKELEAALAAEERPSAAAFRSASGLFAARAEPVRALEILSRGATLHPDDTQLALDRAMLRFLTGDLDGADADCARVAAADTRGIAALLLRGDVRRAKDDLAGARQAYAEAAVRRPDDAEPKLRLAGTSFAESGEQSEGAASSLALAESIAREVLSKSPDHPGALLALAKVRLASSPGRDPPRRGHPVNDDALKLLRRSVAANPLSIEANTFLAYAEHLTRNDREAAIRLVRILDVTRGERPRLRLLLARCLLNGGLLPEAAAAARRAAEQLPDDAEAWRVSAQTSHAAGDRQGALTAFEHLGTIEPAKLQHLFDQAAVLAEMGRFSAAEERFAAAETRTAAIADENERSAAEQDVATARAEFYRLRGDIERAKGSYGAIVDRNPTSAAPYVRYARFLLRLGQRDDAERQVERGLAVEPSSLEARRMLCEIGFSRGEVSAALTAQVEEVARIAPSDPVVLYLRGKLAVLAGDLRIGREMLARYTADRPEDADGQYALGVTLGKAGEYGDAVKRLETAGELMPGSPEVKVALAKVRQGWAVEMMRRGRLVEAQATLRRVVSDDPSSREARALLVDSLRAVGDVDLSEKEVRALLRTDPADRAALRMLAALQVEQRNLDDAAATLRRLTETDGTDWTAWQFLSAVLADKGDLDGAEVAASAARNAAPDEPGALAAMLHVLVLRGDTDGAAREIEAAAAKHPEEAQYPYFLAMLLARQGRHEEAIAAASKALDLKPSMPGALELAIHVISTGLADSDRAAEFARARVARVKDDPVMTYQLASLEAELGRRTEALALLAPICEIEMPLPAALALRGLLLLDSRDFTAARAALRKGIERYADAVDLHYLLAQSWLTDPAHVKDGQPQEPARGYAIAELRAVVAVMKSHAPARNNLAWLLSRDEATRAEALENAEAIVQRYPGYPPYLDTWGGVLLDLGRSAQAVTAFRRALGACEAERAALDKRAQAKLSLAESAKVEALRKRLERVTAEVKTHYEAALKAPPGR